MSGTELGAIIAIVVGYAGGLAATLRYLGDRIDRVDERLGRLEVAVARIGQHLDDHITNHPGPSERLVR